VTQESRTDFQNYFRGRNAAAAAEKFTRVPASGAMDRWKGSRRCGGAAAARNILALA